MDFQGSGREFVKIRPPLNLLDGSYPEMPGSVGRSLGQRAKPSNGQNRHMFRRIAWLKLKKVVIESCFLTSLSTSCNG